MLRLVAGNLITDDGYQDHSKPAAVLEGRVLWLSSSTKTKYKNVSLQCESSSLSFPIFTIEQ